GIELFAIKKPSYTNASWGFMSCSNLGAAFDNFFQTLGRKPYFRCLDPAKCDGEQLGGLGFLLAWC
ncbi:MAG TPA: hypothetical protein ACN46X_07020, partial [Prochlorococcus sp.]